VQAPSAIIAHKPAAAAKRRRLATYPPHNLRQIIIQQEQYVGLSAFKLYEAAVMTCQILGHARRVSGRRRQCLEDRTCVMTSPARQLAGRA
jgi:hypothetical protein